MRTARLVLTPWLCRNSMISRICFASCHACAIRSRRLGPIPSTDCRSVERLSMTARTSAPKCPTSFLARIGPMPLTSPLPRYLSIPSAVVGGTVFMLVALNCSPCSLSLTHQPSALSHSPAVTEGSDPTTVVSSRCPRPFTRRTQKPLSSLWKVTRSISPEISSVAGLRSGIAPFICGDSFCHGRLWLVTHYEPDFRRLARMDRMVERMAKPKSESQPAWTDVKAKLADFDRAALLGLIQSLYTAHKDNQTFLHARFGLAEDVLEPYKKTIDRWLWPDLFRKQDTSVLQAKRAISDYKKAVGDSEGLAELMVFYCERAVGFCSDVGNDDEGYFDALVRMFEQALKLTNGLSAHCRDDLMTRLDRVRVISHKFGYGVGDSMDFLLSKFTVRSL